MQAPNPPDPADARFVIQTAQMLGFALIGIAPARPSEHSGHVRQWIDENRHGEMAYLATNLDIRLDPARLVENAKSVICIADLHPTQTDLPPNGPAPHGRIARYAFGRDYHKSIKKRLHQLADALADRHPDETFRSTVDTAPILEREFAALAGLGWIGKHTLLIHPRLGSYFLLGTIVTTLDLEMQEPESELLPGSTDHCGTCTRCIDACPTNCIATEGPRSLDASRCISYLTIEHRSPIDAKLHTMMDDWIAGCDICQEVCPHNRVQGSGTRDHEEPTGAPQTTSAGRLRLSALDFHPDHTPRPPAPALSLLNILNWTEGDRRQALQGSALKRIKLNMFKRNALIAAGNALSKSEDPALLQRIRELTEDDDELIRTTANQVLARLDAARPDAS